jgi:hypothetical protein
MTNDNGLDFAIVEADTLNKKDVNRIPTKSIEVLMGFESFFEKLKHSLNTVKAGQVVFQTYENLKSACGRDDMNDYSFYSAIAPVAYMKNIRVMTCNVRTVDGNKDGLMFRWLKKGEERIIPTSFKERADKLKKYENIGE